MTLESGEICFACDNDFRLDNTFFMLHRVQAFMGAVGEMHCLENKILVLGDNALAAM